jgi:small subunit ribosomal protein S2
MARTNYQDLLEAGVHFGHLKRKWNPNMAPYIFMERNGIHVIDLHKTVAKLDEACNALKQIAASGKKVMFVATKKQAREAISSAAEAMDMPFVTERWTGGMLTNFVTIRKAIRKMSQIEKILSDPEATGVNKKERLLLKRQKEKLEKNLGSISELNRLPAALFIVDVKKEHIAVKEAKRLNIPTFAIVDTNSDPKLIDFPIPANDDAAKSITKIMDIVVEAVNEGLSERKASKEVKKTVEKPKVETEVKAESKTDTKAEVKTEAVAMEKKEEAK